MQILILLVAIIAIMVGFKFYPRLTRIVLIGFGCLIVLAVLVALAFGKPVSAPHAVTNQTSTEDVIQYPTTIPTQSIVYIPTPTPALMDCVINGHDYQMTFEQCQHAEAQAIAQDEQGIQNIQQQFSPQGMQNMAKINQQYFSSFATPTP